jgi:hypothetical protein
MEAQTHKEKDSEGERTVKMRAMDQLSSAVHFFVKGIGVQGQDVIFRQFFQSDLKLD